MNFSEGYQQLWKAIIRPPRAQYKQQMLGPKIFKFQGLKIQRTDIELTNNRNFKLKCSHFQPYIRPAKQLPCVIYLHGNSSCRLEGRSCIPYILCHDITLFTFDFSGCGNSGGQYISLGYYQKEDVQTVFQYLRSLSTVSSIGLWGRSMGAVTALMYADKNPQIACIVCDSPFSNLQKLCKQLAQRFASGVIAFFSGIALSFISSTIKQKNNFDIAALDPLGKHVKKAYIPAFFIAAKDDNFILPKHTQKLFEAYAGQKKIKIVEGDHNSQRDRDVNEAISVFFYNNLHVQKLIIRDEKFIQQQKVQKSKSKKQQQKLRKQVIVEQNAFGEQQFDEQKVLQYIMKLSLQEYKQKDDRNKNFDKNNGDNNNSKDKDSNLDKKQQNKININLNSTASVIQKKGQQSKIQKRSNIYQGSIISIKTKVQQQKLKQTKNKQKQNKNQENKTKQNKTRQNKQKSQQVILKLSQQNIDQDQLDQRFLK